MSTNLRNEIPTTPKKAKAFNKKFITAEELANRWGLSKSGVYHGASDVSLLRRIPFGRKSIRFLLSEVEEIERQKIEVAT